MLLQDKQTFNIIENFKKASVELNFNMQLFYTLSKGTKSFEYPIYLPEFGGNNGMVVDFLSAPDFTIDKTAVDCAKENNIYFSGISVSLYEVYDIELIKDAFRDWGYFGIQNCRPNWI